MERVAVESRKRIRKWRSDIMTRIPNGNHTWSSGIGSDVVLTPGNFQAYPELLFSFLYRSTR